MTAAPALRGPRPIKPATGPNRATRRAIDRECSPRRMRRLAKRLRVAAAKRECQGRRKAERQGRRWDRIDNVERTGFAYLSGFVATTRLATRRLRAVASFLSRRSAN